MKAAERSAITRILIDLIKADKVIDSREMELYRSLKIQFSISKKDETSAYSMPLSRAITIISEMPEDDKEEILKIFEDMTVSDGFCAREEALLVLALHYCLRLAPEDSCVISKEIDNSLFGDNQVLYVESQHNKQINSEINLNYREITNELKLGGLDFVYIPQIAHHYLTTPRDLLSDVILFLSPAYNERLVAELVTKIKLLKTDSFCIDQLYRKLGFTELCDTGAAIMMKIGQSKVDNKVLTNFLKVEVSENILGLIQQVVDELQSTQSSDTIVVSNKKDERGRFLYMGFYRQLFDIILLEKSISCHMLVDLVHGTIELPEINTPLDGLHRKEKALYTLFIAESKNGGINFTPPESPRAMQNYTQRMKILQKKYSRIYKAFGGDKDKAPDITQPEIRLPMISGIKKAVTKCQEKIFDANSYMIGRDKYSNYNLLATEDSFLYRSFQEDAPISFFESDLYKEIAAYG
jgi:hypothetical protein